MTNFIPNETKVLHDRKLSWINNKMKTMIQEKTQNLSALFEKQNNMLATKLERLQNVIYEILEICKSKCYENI